MPIAGISASGSYQAAIQGAQKQKTDVNIDDFLALIAVQLQNQDMMNPMKDTEFMGQMAQFTTMQIMQGILEQSATGYAMSMLGKEVEAAVMAGGKLEVTRGTVDSVSLYEGQPVLYIGDKGFTMDSVMIVRQGAGTPGAEGSKPENGGTASEI